MNVQELKNKVNQLIDEAYKQGFEDGQRCVEQSVFDFEDGQGEVPAHRHVNTDGSLGGWVADTAKVAHTVYVGPHARVYGYAGVYDRAIIDSRARVSGYASVSNRAMIHGDAHVYGIATVAEHANIHGNARIHGNAYIAGHANISECTRINQSWKD